MLIDVIDKGLFRPARRQLQNTRRCFEVGGVRPKISAGDQLIFSMLIGYVRWIGLLANVWCSNLSEFCEKSTQLGNLPAETGTHHVQWPVEFY